MEMLKPCPRCGGDGVYSVHFLSAWVRCEDCGYTVTGANEDEAGTKWNGEAEDECQKCRI